MKTDEPLHCAGSFVHDMAATNGKISQQGYRSASSLLSFLPSARINRLSQICASHASTPPPPPIHTHTPTTPAARPTAASRDQPGRWGVKGKPRRCLRSSQLCRRIPPYLCRRSTERARTSYELWARGSALKSAGYHIGWDAGYRRTFLEHQDSARATEIPVPCSGERRHAPWRAATSVATDVDGRHAARTCSPRADDNHVVCLAEVGFVPSLSIRKNGRRIRR
jgi:hypothetical protein